MVLALQADLDTWLRFMGRLHPMVVHFPLALIVMALLVEIASLFRRDHRVSKTAFVCLVAGASTAVLAAWFGWLNADHEPHGASVTNTIFLHRWIGVTAVGAAVAAILFAIPARLTTRRFPRQGYLAMLLISAVLVMVGGHFGGTLVYGNDYLTSVFNTTPDTTRMAAAPTTEPATAAPHITPVVDTIVIDPADVDPHKVVAIIEANCARCHGAQKQRGDLRLSPIAAAFSNDRDTWVIQPGKPDKSVLMERITLPAGHADLMPRGEDQPLAPEEIAMLRAWILAGAPAPPAAVVVAPPVTEPEPTPEPEPEPEPAVAVSPLPPAPALPDGRQGTIDWLTEHGASVTPISALTQQLDINLSTMEPPATDADLHKLLVFGQDVTWLNLAGTDISDKGCETLSKMTGLERLRLERTSVSDVGVAKLVGLGGLTQLNLHSTAVTDASLEKIGGLQKLERLYLWQTAVTVDGVAKLRVRNGKLRIVRSEPVEEAPEAVKAPTKPPTKPGDTQKEAPAQTAEAVEDTSAQP